MRVLKSKECMQVIIIITWSILGVAATPRCDPEVNMYYHRQADRCFPCDRCYKGEEPIPLESWEFNWDGETGPTQCRPCRKCRSGTFSDKRSYNTCQPCKNCTLYNQYETVQCTNERNTVCDGLKPTTSLRPIPEPESSHDKNDSGSKWVYIVGIICLTVFGVAVLVIVRFCIKQRLYMICKRRRHGSSTQGGQTPTENQSNGQISISIPAQEGTGDLEPLLQKISNSNQSIAHSSIQLEETGPLELDSILTSHSQESLDGPFSFPVDQRPSYAAENTRFEREDNRNSAALSICCSTASEIDQEVTEMNQVTDGASTSFSRKIKYDRQGSYPYDEKGGRDDKSSASDLSEKVSNNELSDGAKVNKENKVLEEKFLHSISKHLVKERLYVQIARECGLEEADIEVVRMDHRHESVQEESYQMLRRLVMKCRTTQADFIEAVGKHDQLALEKVIQFL